WEEARRAWSAYGVKLEPGSGPIDMKLGLTPIRLNPEASAEVVWCDRIDPARAIIRSIPFPSSGHRFADLLLHDGAPNGYRLFQGKEVPVFDELEILEPSGFSTFEAVVEASNPADRDALIALAAERKIPIENWSTVRVLCRLCSQGRPHQKHQPQPPDEGPLVRYGIASQSESEVDSLLETWQRGRIGCLILEFDCVLE
ncbi:MAG: tetratricopeptide repeat protein, partial [Chloroflexi bacterium]|nr:tetratricopeptide repeat protein [Chloroflexota bacterium]